MLGEDGNLGSPHSVCADISALTVSPRWKSRVSLHSQSFVDGATHHLMEIDADCKSFSLAKLPTSWSSGERADFFLGLLFLFMPTVSQTPGLGI